MKAFSCRFLQGTKTSAAYISTQKKMLKARILAVKLFLIKAFSNRHHFKDLKERSLKSGRNPSFVGGKAVSPLRKPATFSFLTYLIKVLVK